MPHKPSKLKAKEGTCVYVCDFLHVCGYVSCGDVWVSMRVCIIYIIRSVYICIKVRVKYCHIPLLICLYVLKNNHSFCYFSKRLRDDGSGMPGPGSLFNPRASHIDG